MAVTKDRKAELIKQYVRTKKDSGSAQVQVLFLLSGYSSAHRPHEVTRRTSILVVVF